MPQLRVLTLPSGAPDTAHSWMAFARHPGTHRLEVLAIEPDFAAQNPRAARRRQEHAQSLPNRTFLSGQEAATRPAPPPFYYTAYRMVPGARNDGSMPIV